MNNTKPAAVLEDIKSCHVVIWEGIMTAAV